MDSYSDSERKGVSTHPYNRVFDDTDSSKDEAEVSLTARATSWWAHQVAQHQHRTATYSAVDWLSVFLPCVRWLRKYNVRENLLGDIAAGISIGVMVVPQGMSYAILAGLPAVFGLYGAFVPVLVYACFGSSPQLAVGPVAVTSLLLNEGLNQIVPGADEISDPNNPKTPELAAIQESYNHAAIQVAFIVAIMYTAIGVCQLGFLANFLSHAVISGFTSGASIIIALSQMKYFFGVKTPNTSTAIETIHELSKVIDDSRWQEMVFFLVWLALLLTIKKIGKTYKRFSWIRSLGPITVCLLGIFFVKVMDLDSKGTIKVVKKIPSGLPPVTISWWKPLLNGDTPIGKQMKLAIVVLLVDFMESISIAKALARRGRYQIRVTQEIVGMGFANFMGSMFSAYTTTGSFSRSAVSADVGSKTGLFGIVSSGLVMLVLLVLTPVFELVPYNAMGAIVVSACFGLFEGSEARFLYKANFLDFLVWVAAFLGTVLAGVEIGLAIAIGLAILLVVYQSAFPHTATLGRLPGTSVYRSIKQYPSALEQKGMLIMRVDAPVYFANVQTIRTRMEKYLARARANPALAPIKFVILDLSPVPFIDATGMHAFLELVSELKDDGIQLVLANPCANVKSHIARVHLLEAIGKEWVFVRTADAVDVCSRELIEHDDKVVDDEFPRAMTEAKETNGGHNVDDRADSAGLPINWPGRS